MNTILLSVIVPVYNVESYLKDCLDSIISQTYRNLEIILVDDGSTDSSGTICDEYAENDDRVIVIHQANKGIVAARKTGVRAAIGMYSTYVDSDDWIDMDYYERLINDVLIYNPDVITSGVRREYSNNYVDEYDKIEPGYYEGQSLKDPVLKRAICYDEFYEEGINVHIYNKLYKTELLKKYQLMLDDKIHVGDDAAVVYPLIFNARSVLITHKNGYHYRIRKGSCMDTHLKNESESLDLLQEHLYKTLTGKDVANVVCQIKMFMKYVRLLQVPEEVFVKTDFFDVAGIADDENIILYGKGRFGKAIMEYLNNRTKISIVDWIDSTDLYDDDRGKKKLIKKLLTSNNRIFIAVLKANMRIQIAENLRFIGIKEDRIIGW